MSEPLNARKCKYRQDNSLQSYQNRWTNTMTKTDKLEKLQRLTENFRSARNWQQFHTPKNLVMALSVECSELVEIFQWLTPEQSCDPESTLRTHIEEEIGDVMIYLSLLSSTFGIDPIEAGLKKMVKNEIKHPAPISSQPSEQ